MAEFYLDENVAERLSDELEARSHDSVSTNALGHKGASDPEQLTYAVDLNRIFVTHNEADFTMLHKAWHRWSRRWNVSEQAEHFGIIVVRQAMGLTVEETAVRISECHGSYGPLNNRLFVLNHFGWQEIAPPAG